MRNNLEENKKEDDNIREAELLYRTLFNQSPDGILLIDPNGKFIQFNEAAHTALGYTHEEFTKLTLSDIDPFQSREELEASFRKVFAEGSAEFEVKHKTKQGEIRDVYVITQLMTLSGRTFFHTIWRDITEHNRADKALMESNANLRALINAIPDIVIFKDVEGRYLMVNKAVEESTGIKADELLGKTNEEILPPVLAEMCSRSDESTLKSGRHTKTEEQAIGKDGKKIFLDTIKAPIHDAQGRLIGLVAISRDVTEHKQIEEALQRSETNYRSLLEQASDGIAVVDRRGRYVDVNARMCAMMGYSREELLQLMVEDIVAPEDLRDRPLRFPELLEGKTILSERIMRRKDGSTFPVEISAKMIPDGRLCGIHRDITGHRRIEEELRKSEKFIRDILETVDEGFIVIDREYRILSANKAYLDQVKMPLEEVMGRHCHAISHRLKKACSELGEECPVKHTFKTGEPSTALHIHHDKDGDPLYVETKSYPLKDSTGTTISAIEIIHNTTEKRKLEAQLRHAQKMEAVGQLTGGIAHDFNNILTAVTGYGSLIMGKMDEGDPLRNYLQQILDSADRAATLTQSLLAFARKQAISARPVNLNTIIENVEKLLRRLIGEDIETKVILDPEDLTVMADSGQIEQVLINLATNARDAMPEGGYLTIQTQSIFLDREFLKLHGYGKIGTYALISVTDTGTGMDEKTKEKIFEPFFTTKETGKGTGLGLSIVYGIVKQHNGYITCYSEPDRGSTFKLYLPMIKLEIPKKETDALLSVSSGTETVLLAEDDATVRSLVKEVLEEKGYMVISAIDGEEAIERFKENRDTVHLLILDVVMPRKNGKEVYEEIRKERPDAKVIFTSGYTPDILHKKEIPEKDLNIVSKPISPNELLKKVREVLDT